MFMFPNMMEYEPIDVMMNNTPNETAAVLGTNEESNPMDADNNEEESGDLGSVWDEDLFKTNARSILDSRKEQLKLIDDNESKNVVFDRLFRPSVVTIDSIKQSLGILSDDNKRINDETSETLKSYLFSQSVVKVNRLKYADFDSSETSKKGSFSNSPVEADVDSNLLEKCLDILKSEKVIRC